MRNSQMLKIKPHTKGFSTYPDTFKGQYVSSTATIAFVLAVIEKICNCNCVRPAGPRVQGYPCVRPTIGTPVPKNRQYWDDLRMNRWNIYRSEYLLIGISITFYSVAVLNLRKNLDAHNCLATIEKKILRQSTSSSIRNPMISFETPNLCMFRIMQKLSRMYLGHTTQQRGNLQRQNRHDLT